MGKVITRDTFEGFLPESTIDALYAVMDEALAEALRAIIEQHNLALTYKGKDYAHLAILSLGLWQDSTMDRIVDETKQFKKVPFSFDQNFTVIVPIPPFELPLKISALETMLSMTLTKQSIAVSCDINKGSSDILPDTDCPSNIALYQRLQGTIA